MKIGELAKQAGITSSAIRFYEASGLLPAGTRGPNGYRAYGAEALARLRFIQLAQRLGFPLDRLRMAFEQGEGTLPKDVVMVGLQRRREEIARMRSELDAQDAELQRLAQTCSDGWARGECVDPAAFLARAEPSASSSSSSSSSSPPPRNRSRSRRQAMGSAT